MLGREAFRVYIPLRLHFTSDYDIIKYRAKTGTLLNTYKNRNDRFYFEKLGMRFQSHQKLSLFLLPQFLNNPHFHISESLGEEAHDLAIKWTADVSAMDYSFEEDSKYLLDKYNLNELLKEPKNGDHPLIFKELLNQEIKFETYLIYCEIFSILEKWTSINDIVYTTWKSKTLNYSTFLNLESDIERYKNIIKNLLKTY